MDVLDSSTRIRSKRNAFLAILLVRVTNLFLQGLECNVENGKCTSCAVSEAVDEFGLCVPCIANCNFKKIKNLYFNFNIFLGIRCDHTVDQKCFECQSPFKVIDYKKSSYVNLGDPNYQDDDFCIDATNLPSSENGLYLASASSLSFEKCQVTNCWSCLASNTCEECKDPNDSSNLLYPFDDNGYSCDPCLQSQGLYLDSDSKCHRCSTNCQTCSLFSHCLTCPDGTFLQPSTPTCDSECPPLFYKDLTQNKCLPCDSSCKTN